MTKKESIALLFYPEKWCEETKGMTLEEQGIYMNVLILQLKQGKLQENEILKCIENQLFLNSQKEENGRIIIPNPNEIPLKRGHMTSYKNGSNGSNHTKHVKNASTSYLEDVLDSQQIETLQILKRGHMTSPSAHMTSFHLKKGQKIWQKIKKNFVKNDAQEWYHKLFELEKEKRVKYIQSRNNNSKGANQHTTNPKKSKPMKTMVKVDQKKDQKILPEMRAHMSRKISIIKSSITTPLHHEAEEDLKNKKNNGTPTKKINSNNNLPKDILNSHITPKLFDKFWKLFPRKVAKGKTLTKWNQICARKNNRPTWKEIKSAIILQKKSEQWQTEKYIPHPSTWLNQSRWLDDPSTMIAYKRDEVRPPKFADNIRYDHNPESGMWENSAGDFYVD